MRAPETLPRLTATLPRPLPLPTSPKRYTKSLCLLTRRAFRPLQFARDDSCLGLLTRERLEGACVFLRPGSQLPSHLRYPLSLAPIRQRISGHHNSKRSM